MTLTCVTTVGVQEVKASEWVFEEDFEGNVADWSFENAGEIVQDPNDSGNKVLKMNFDNDYSWGYAVHDVTLKPNTSYLMEVRVKGDDISVSEQYKDGIYVNIWSDMGYPVDYVNDFQTTSFGWNTMQVYFYTTSRGVTRIQCGVDGVKGTAYFDNIRIKEYTYTDADADKRIIKESENIRLSMIPQSLEVSGISEEQFQQLVDDLQTAYKAYYDLTGSAPFYGDKINILENLRPAFLRYAAIAGNPINLSGNQISALQLFMNKDAVNFGWLHEIGHDFDNGFDIETGIIYKYGWDFHDEFWANTKMLYVLDTTDVAADFNGEKVTSLAEILPQYKKNYDKWHTDSEGEFNDSYHDALTYIFGTIIQDIGWEPFIKAFHQYTAKEIPTPITRLARLERFLYAVQQNCNPSGNEVMEHFKDGEYEAIRNYYFNLDAKINTDLDSRRGIANEQLLNILGEEEYPPAIQAVIDSEKKLVAYAGSPDELTNIIEYVKKVISPITVSYKDEQGNIVATREVKPGDNIPTDITPNNREHYSFDGWYMDEECTVPISEASTDILEKEITVYPKWDIIHYTINYELNGGINSALNPVEFTIENNLIVFAAPNREGYLFDGWYRNPDFTKQICDFEPKDYSSTALENFTIYAKWKENPVTATPEPTVTVTPEPTVTVTLEPTVTVTPEPTATATPEPTVTVTPEPTVTVTPEPTVTVTPEPTATATPEPTITATPEPTITVTLEPTATLAPESTITVAPEESVTPIPSSQKISMKKVHVTKIPTQYYYGKTVQPKVKITYQGKVLKKGSDYTLSYKNNKKPGKGKITITGKGSYKGTKTVTFKLVNGFKKYKVTSKTALYKRASDKSKKIMVLSKGKSVKVYVGSGVKDVKKRKWIKIKVGSKTGYVLVKKIKKVK